MRGQSSLEFLAFVSMSSLILAVMYGVVADKQGAITESTISNEASATAQEVGFQVEMALVQQEGYTRNFSVPGQIGGQNYDVSIGYGNVLLENSETSKLESTLYQGDWINFSTDKTNKFRVKNNGSVHIEKR